MISKYIKFFSAVVYCLLSFPFVLAGFLWKEIKDSFEEGKQLSKWTSEKYGRWLDGN